MVMTWSMATGGTTTYYHIIVGATDQASSGSYRDVSQYPP